MTKEFCDRCGQEIKRVRLPIPKGLSKLDREVWIETNFVRWGWMKSSYRLCCKCQRDLKKFLNDPVKWSEEDEEVIED